MTSPSIITERRLVPNLPPVTPAPYRIAIIGDAPDYDAENHGYPFVGKSGNFLTNILRDIGINRNACFLGHICQSRPPGNDAARLPWDGPEIQSGLTQLDSDLTTFSPNICLLLGSVALKAAKINAAKLLKFRGSLFLGDFGPFANRKCVPSFAPGDVLKDFSGFPLLKFDCGRALAEGVTPDLNLPHRDLITHYPASMLIEVMDTWPSGLRCSLDIEGGLPLDKVHPDEVEKNKKRPEEKRRSYGWPCVSICARPTLSITIAWTKFSVQDHALVLQSFARLMFRTDVPKVLQNSLYDNFVLSFGYRIPIRNVVEDTMLKGWEVYCELPKSLGVQASIWTREPFYKAERKSGDAETFYRYCAKDSAVTLEICNAQDSALDPSGLVHYRKNVDMLNPLLYMELRGINYDQESAKKQLGETETEIKSVGDELCQVAGRELRGKLGSLSSQRLAKYLYVDAGYPPQFKKEAGRKTDKFTTDIEALLTLRKKLPSDPFLAGILRHRHLEGIAETLSIYPDPDGRVRCGYNVVGTETGRLTCYTSPTGAGANLQTITKKLRKNYRADPGFDFFQCSRQRAVEILRVIAAFVGIIRRANARHGELGERDQAVLGLPRLDNALGCRELALRRGHSQFARQIVPPRLDRQLRLELIKRDLLAVGVLKQGQFSAKLKFSHLDLTGDLGTGVLGLNVDGISIGITLNTHLVGLILHLSNSLADFSVDHRSHHTRVLLCSVRLILLDNRHLFGRELHRLRIGHAVDLGDLLEKSCRVNAERGVGHQLRDRLREELRALIPRHQSG